MDNKDATKAATPATMIVARVNLSPVPPETPPPTVMVAATRGLKLDSCGRQGIREESRVKLG